MSPALCTLHLCLMGCPRRWQVSPPLTATQEGSGVTLAKGGDVALQAQYRGGYFGGR